MKDSQKTEQDQSLALDRDQSTTRKQDLLELGRVVSAYGLKGWIKVQPLASDSVLPKIKNWWVESASGQLTALRILSAKVHGTSVVALPEGFEERNAAESLKGSKVFALRRDFPKTSITEYYVADLVGCTVLDPDGQILGVIKQFQDHGAHPIMELDGDALLVPFVDSIVRKVDLASRQIQVDWRADYLS